MQFRFMNGQRQFNRKPEIRDVATKGNCNGKEHFSIQNFLIEGLPSEQHFNQKSCLKIKYF